MIPRKFKGKVSALLSKTDERGVLRELISKLDISDIVDRKIDELSGGELQRVTLGGRLGGEGFIHRRRRPVRGEKRFDFVRFPTEVRQVDLLLLHYLLCLLELKCLP